MIHSEAIEQLADFACGALDGDLSAAVAEHVRECRSCHGWLETHDLLVAALAGACQHPGSDVLALCAVRPHEEFEHDRSDVREHLCRCAGCRDDLETVAAAVREARPTEKMETSPTWARTASHRRWAAVAVVAGAIAVGGAITLAVLQSVHPGASRVARPGAGSAAAVRSLPSDQPSGELQDTEISGDRVIQTAERLTIARTRIRDGASVTIRATETVSFGNGFQVEPGARVTVATGG